MPESAAAPYGTRSAAVADDPTLAQRIRGLRAAGLSFRDIAAVLNAEGVPTRRGGLLWRPSALQVVLGWQRSREVLARQIERQRAAERAAATPTRGTWRAMLLRCYQRGHPSFPDYGGRGVIVCARWHSFEAFLEDMGERPPGRSLDRIDPRGNYEPSNCRWATAREQRLNRRDKKRLEVVDDR